MFKKMTISDIERFCKKFVVVKSGCWLWTACKVPKGYGLFSFERKVYQAHRVSHQLVYGQIAKGMVCDHLCRVRSCVNPRHIEVVTNAENIRRGNTGKHMQLQAHRKRVSEQMKNKTTPKR